MSLNTYFFEHDRFIPAYTGLMVYGSEKLVHIDLFIPAYTGLMQRCKAPTLHDPVHPRIYGVNAFNSPGKLSKTRFIPAYTGLMASYRFWAVHNNGSSPYARGNSRQRV